ncbi:MAG: hypothetical protein EAZ95_01765 [Bacteroidetes bacterium]|nr:MAG: hypothetical protein EAZ95_01765 [Bacteroidota bacterium]
MINIQRSPIAPASLQTAEIQAYIQDAIAYLQDKEQNPNNPTVPKPEKPPAYRNSDLLEAFDRDFFSKCYLTEEKFVNAWIMDIEHFVGKAERPDLTFEWTNLFPASHQANMLKPRKTPAGGYLNPCEDDVETEILYSLSAYGEKPYFEAKDTTNQKAVNTCALLDRVHNGHDKDTQQATAQLRHVIQKKYMDILNKILEWKDAKEGSQEKLQAKRELKDLLSRKASFTMLLHSMPAVRRLPPDFFD